MSKHKLNENARTLAGYAALTWLDDEANHVSGARKRSRTAASSAVLRGWLLVVQPVAWSHEPREWARLIQCPACGHTYCIGRSSAAFNHKWLHDRAGTGDKFVEVSIAKHVDDKLRAIDEKYRDKAKEN